MSTTTTENKTEPRNEVRRGSARDGQALREAGSEQLEQALTSTEAAVVELVHGSVNTVQAFLPRAMVRPTEAVTLTFDLIEQLARSARRVAFEIASIIESGAKGVEERAA